ncbi:MAG: hypothetical protein ABIT04_12955 [Novosphingobium sp.]
MAILTNRAPAEAPALAILLSLLSTLPFLVARQPQLTDYASHLARYHVMLNIGRSAWLARYYQFHWIWTGNLGVDLLMWPLGRILGVETAGWLIGLLIPPLTGLALVTVEWVLRRRVGVGALLALTLIWSPAMGMGFANFCLSLALALFAFALWVRLDGWRWRWLAFVPIGFAVWLCHATGWGVLGVLVFGYEWHKRNRPSAFLAPWPLTLPLVPMLLAGGAGGGTGARLYGPHPWFYKKAVLIQTMRDQSFALDRATPLILLLLILAAMVLRRFDGRLGWGAWLIGALVLAVPRHLGGGDYADYRLIPVALMIGCLAIDWRAPRLLLWLAPLLFLVRLDLTTEAWARNSRILEADLKALDQLPMGARVAGAVLVERTGWKLNPFEHAPSYATVRRDALVNSHFAIPGVHMLQLRERIPDFVDPSHRLMHWPGEPIDLARFAPAHHADYLWYFGWSPPTALPPGASVLYRTRHSLLARLAKPPASR